MFHFVASFHLLFGKIATHNLSLICLVVRLVLPPYLVVYTQDS